MTTNTKTKPDMELELDAPRSTEIAQRGAGQIDLQGPIEAAVALGPEGVETLERLERIYARQTARSAKTAFDRAKSELHARLRPVVKSKTAVVKQGFSYQYADLAAIEAALRKAGAYELGFSWHWDSEYEEGGRPMSICVLSHRDGHVERSRFPVMPDTRENRAITDGQKQRAATTYADRATLVRVFGITSLVDPDTDGVATDYERVTDEQALTLEATCKQNSEAIGKPPARVKDRLMTHLGATDWTDVPAAKYDEAMGLLGKLLESGK